MEHSRYEQNPTLFIMGIICQLLSMIFFIFAAYLIPFLFFKIKYDVPEFLSHFRTWFDKTYGFDVWVTSTLIFLTFLAVGFIFGLLANKASNRMDEEVLHLKQQEDTEQTETSKKEPKQKLFTVKLVFKIISIFVGIYLLIQILGWIFSNEPSEIQEIEHGFLEKVKIKTIK